MFNLAILYRSPVLYKVQERHTQYDCLCTNLFDDEDGQGCNGLMRTPTSIYRSSVEFGEFKQTPAILVLLTAVVIRNHPGIPRM